MSGMPKSTRTRKEFLEVSEADGIHTVKLCGRQTKAAAGMNNLIADAPNYTHYIL